MNTQIENRRPVVWLKRGPDGAPQPGHLPTEIDIVDATQMGCPAARRRFRRGSIVPFSGTGAGVTRMHPLCMRRVCRFR